MNTWEEYFLWVWEGLDEFKRGVGEEKNRQLLQQSLL
jgi:hypothetical protein